MRSGLDFSSWQGVVSTLLGLVVVSLVAVGIRLLVMHRVQQRREQQNRQINERLKTLIAAYKTLGGSFTGELAVDPSHRRDLRARAKASADDGALAGSMPAAPVEDDGTRDEGPGAERRRRVRDAVEAALSDVILLGTEAQVRLAVRAAQEMVDGKRIEIAPLVVSLRTFIREVLDLDPIPSELAIPKQGPLRTGAGASRGSGARGEGGGGAGRGGAAAGAGAGGVGLAGGAALGGGLHRDPLADHGGPHDHEAGA